MPNFDAAETAALAKFKQFLEDNGEQVFTADEVKTLRDMITAWNGLAALGFVGRLLRPGVWLIGFGLAVFLAFKGKFESLIHLLGN